MQSVSDLYQSVTHLQQRTGNRRRIVFSAFFMTAGEVLFRYLRKRIQGFAQFGDGTP